MIYRFPKLYGDGRSRLAIAIICFVIGQATALGLGAYATRRIFATLHSDLPSVSFAPFVLLALSSVIYGFCGVIAARQAERLGQSFAISFRKNFYGQLSIISASTLQKKRLGALAIRFVGDLGAMREWTSKGVTGCLSAAIITPVGLVVLWTFSPLYGAAVLTSVLLALTAMAFYGGRLASTHAKMRKERANLSIEMMERAGAAPAIRSLGRLRKDQKLLARRGDELSDASQTRARQREILTALPDVFLAFGGVTLLFLTMRYSLPVSHAAAGMAVVSIVAAPLRNLANVWDSYCAWRIAREKSQKIFEMPTISLDAETKPLPKGPLSVELCDVQVSEVSIDNSFVEPGSIAVLSGAQIDATLCLHAIASMERIERGEIKLGGVNLHSIKPQEFSNRIALISMQNPILQGSLRRALTLGCRKRPTDDEIIRVARQFGLETVIDRLGGLSGRVDENGRNLADSEQLKLHFAGACLASPSLILIDVPIALVDTEMSRFVAKFMESRPWTVILTPRAYWFTASQEEPILITLRKTGIPQPTVPGSPRNEAA